MLNHVRVCIAFLRDKYANSILVNSLIIIYLSFSNDLNEVRIGDKYLTRVHRVITIVKE